MAIFEKINKAALNFLMPLTLEEIYKTIANEAVKLINGSNSSIYLRDKSTGSFYSVYRLRPEVASPRKKGNLYKAFKTGKSFVVYRKNLIKAHPEIRNQDNQSWILIPLTCHKKTYGVLMVMSKDNVYFSKKELDILTLFGSMSTLAIKKTQLYSEVKEALGMRDLFISMAAHELRTPLTSINGFIQLLYKKHVSKNNKDSKWTKYLLWESMRLTNLINELLSVNKIKSKKLQFSFKECSIKEIIFRSLTAFKFLHPKKKLIIKDHLEKECETIIGDNDKLIRVFNNILDNAVKFSTDSKAIALTLRSRNSNVIVEIKDKGKGIPKKELPFIFQEFYRGKNARHEGMGLGLYLSRYIIDKHRGKIKVESTLNKGTEVKVTLPIAKI
jgi:K+-sensing histidine kinase KdpD